MEMSGNKAITRDVTVCNKRGLHLRLAGALVKVIAGFSSQVQITKGRLTVNARSMLDLVSLSAAPGSKIQVTVTGEDAEATMAAVEKFFTEYSSEA